MRASLLRRCLLLIPAGSLFCLVASAGAEQPAPTPGRSTSEGKPDASVSPIPAVSPVAKPAPRAPKALRTLQVLPAGDRGSSFTDDGFGEAAAPPTEHERMKLDRARQAVEAARAMGLLQMVARPAAPLALPSAALEAEKFRAMEQWRTAPRAISNHPGAGVGDALAPVQLRGPEGLNAIERQKLDALMRGETFVEPAPPPPAKPRVEPAKVDAGRKDRKEGQ
ncbi:MAG TPA: hypothetical protein VIY56_15985 [Vicinamibacterales bacterium]